MSKQHARFAASSAERWVNCPASDYLISMAPKRLSANRAADEGTTAHDLMDFVLNANVKDVARFFENDDRYTDEMKQAVQAYADLVRDTMDLIKADDGLPELYIEERVEAGNLHPFDAFGTADTIVVDRKNKYLYIFDFKFGRGFVDVTRNEQLMYYATAFAYQHDLDLSEYEVQLNIFQPRTDPAHRHYNCDSVDLEVFEESARFAIDKIESDGQFLQPKAGKWCKFCEAKPLCPALSLKALHDAKLDFSDDPEALPLPKT